MIYMMCPLPVVCHVASTKPTDAKWVRRASLQRAVYGTILSKKKKKAIDGK